jgi:alkylation response protein AidB-like acyl-CoA dehydrogenase
VKFDWRYHFPLGGVNQLIDSSPVLARALTIASGTSEVQRTIIAQRLLGLPQGMTPTSAGYATAR